MRDIEYRRFLGLNQDDNEKDLPNGDFRFAENLSPYQTQDGKGGIIQNINGNRLVPFTLPAGNNKAVGIFDDRNENTTIYFLWNSNGDHGIYRYFYDSDSIHLLIQDSVLNFNPDTKISGVALIDQKILKWCDGENWDRKLNIEKADLVDKKQKFRLYAATPTGIPGTPYQVDITGSVTGLNTVTYNTVATDIGDLKVFIENLYNALVAGIGANFSITNYGSFIEIEASNVEDLSVVLLRAGVPSSEFDYRWENRYPAIWQESYINDIKYPPRCEPSVNYGIASDRDVNYLKDRLFQFRYRFIYDDEEKSAWSPISLVAIPTTTFIGISNFIDVTFDDAGDRLVRRIELAFRISNNDPFLGDIQILPEDFVVYAGTSPSFRFYRDGAYSQIDSIEERKLFDSQPIRSNSLDFVKDRIFKGGILEGYDQIPVDAEIDVNVGDTLDPNLGGIKGRIRIQNPLAAGVNPSLLNQPIHTYKFGISRKTAYGGIGAIPSTFTSYDVLDFGYNQLMNIQGFPVYLAGTAFYAITRQVVVTYAGGPPVSLVEGYLKDSYKNRNLLVNFLNAGGDWYQEFEINNIPPGDYFLRVGPHGVTIADLQDGSFRDKSTRIREITGLGANTYEIPVNITAGVLTDLSGANDFIVEDLAYSLGSGSTDQSNTGREGYITDDTGDSVENALCNLRSGTSPTEDTIYSDHNGYYYLSALKPNTGAANTLSAEVFGYNPPGPGTISTNVIYTSPFVTGQYMTVANSVGVVSAIRQEHSTMVLGYVVDAADGVTPVPGVQVIASSGRVVSTDITGEFRIKVYHDQNSSTRTLDLLFHNPNGPLTTFVVPFLTLLFTIDPSTGYHDLPTPNYLTVPGEVEATINTAFIGQTKTLKSGGEYQFGIVYYDEGNRSTTVLTNPFLDISVPFITEPGGSGYKSLTWEIRHRPPDWAVGYQWVRTQNKAFDFYLQWLVNNTNYFEGFSGGSPVLSGTPSANTTEIWLNVQNIVTYAENNSGSTLSYDFAVGDRIRIIKDASGAFLTQYIDVEVKGFFDNQIRVEYDPGLVQFLGNGVFVEVYRPLLDLEEVFYFEIGECYPILDAKTVNRRHGGGSGGNSQDQSANLTTPALGTFRSGDTYVRDRFMPVSGVNIQETVEDSSFNDFFVSDFECIGRPNLFDLDAKQVYRKATIRWSQEYIPETAINGTSTFEPNDARTLDISVGDISKLAKVGNVMLAFQIRKTATCYINERIYSDKLGNDTVAISTEVLSDYRYLAGDYGSTHPMSVVVNNNYVYFFDSTHGQVCRYGPDGITSVSKIFKMDSFFKRVGNEIGEALDVRVFGMYDYNNDEYILGLTYNKKVGLDTEGEPVYVQQNYTIAFNEKANRWTSFYSFHPDNGAGIKQKIITIKDGAFYVHDNSNRCEFYGQTDPSKITIVFNKTPQIRKIAKNLGIDSNGDWSSPDIRTPKGQSTRVLLNRFVRKEGKLYAAIPRDLNTVNVTDPIVNGREMRDYFFEVDLEVTTNDFIQMDDVHLEFVPSSPVGR